MFMLSSKPIIAFLPTTDYELSRPFFRDKLGLRLVSEDGFAMVFDAHGTMLRVIKLRDLSPQKFTVLGWEVEDIAAELDGLVKAGVTFEHYGLPNQDERGIWSAPGGAKVAWFKDPDGNTLSISQHL